jgi:hypothetical protein
MANVERLRELLEGKLEAAIQVGGLPDVDKLAAALQATAETEKAYLEVEKFRLGARSENLRFWIPVIAPTIGAFALVATLVFQIHQLNVNSELQRAAEQGTELRDVIKAASLPKEMTPLATNTRLRSFLSASSPHQQEARDLAVVLLATSPDPAAFDFLLDGLVETTDHLKLTNLRDLIRLSGVLREQWENLNDYLADLKAQAPPESLAGGPPMSPGPATMFRGPQGPFPPTRPFPVPMSPVFAGMTPAQTQKLLDRFADEIQQVGDTVADLLRNSPESKNADLTTASFSYDDLADLNLTNANLTKTYIQNSLVKDSNFGKVEKFADSDWTGTAWWRAKRMSPQLLAYLKQNYVYDSKSTYYQDSTDASTYTAELTRLGGAGGG